jgi:hypothetical protein
VNDVRARILAVLTALSLVLPGAVALAGKCGAEWQLAPCCCSGGEDAELSGGGQPDGHASLEAVCCCELVPVPGSGSGADDSAIRSGAHAPIPSACTVPLATIAAVHAETCSLVPDLARPPPARTLLAHKTSLRC